jgi:hypothetical protein
MLPLFSPNLVSPAASGGQVAGLQCATVTVALSAVRSWASGLPTMIERPITSASNPTIRMRGLRQHVAGLRLARCECRQDDRDATDIEEIKAVDVLAGVDRSDHFVRTDLRRQQKLDQNPVNVPIAVKPGDERKQRGLARRCRQPVIYQPHAGPSSRSIRPTLSTPKDYAPKFGHHYPACGGSARWFNGASKVPK